MALLKSTTWAEVGGCWDQGSRFTAAAGLGGEGRRGEVTCPSPSCLEEHKAGPDPETGLQCLPCEILLSVFWSEAKGGKSHGFQGLRN